ncbi:MAG TPA: ARMT1-like domain-containing protein [Planctomycetota bacterium]|nr:ARMT1-like domain-containing protein [Planctomycetota bacterium]
MKTSLECIPCFLRQALDAARLAGTDPSVHEAVLRKVMDLASRMDLTQAPPLTGQKIHRIIRVLTGGGDPYRAIKERYNRFALGLYPELKQRVRLAEDPFATAVRLAIAGNLIDFGVCSDLSEDDVRRELEATLSAPIDAEALETFRRAVDVARHVFYIADNAGEIVFDRLLIEQMLPRKVTLAVRGHAVINDATREDARAAGLTDLVEEVVDNGGDVPGVLLGDVPETFRRAFDQADVVVAKGQGNYETLSDAPREVFFLVKAKCPVIADDIGCKTGAVVVTRRVPAERVT